MMYLLLILFFGSFFGIIFMIGRKLSHIQRDLIQIPEDEAFEIPHLDVVKHHTLRSIKMFGHIGVIILLRLYVKITNFVKNLYEEVQTKVINWSHKNHSEQSRREISKFLKGVSDYKKRIREIKHKITEEENKQ